MDVHKIKSIEVDAPASTDSKEEWIEKYIPQFQQRFQQWQQSISIDSREYRKYLEKELADYWEDPLLKSLVESM